MSYWCSRQVEFLQESAIIVRKKLGSLLLSATARRANAKKFTKSKVIGASDKS